VKSDVFRRPKCSMLFSILIGTGIQIFAMLFFLILFAMVGINQRDYRAILVSSLYVLFILLSNLSGFFSARFYKMF
jgi:transmembrane 9 superfamily protein 2/4